MEKSQDMVCSKCKSTKFYNSWCGDGETYFKCANFDCHEKFYADGFKRQNNLDLHTRIRLLEQKISEIVDKLDKIYYAPGMPGYVEAKSHYETS